MKEPTRSIREPTDWARVAEVGSSLGLRITVACYRLFGRPVSLVLVHCIVAYFFLTRRSARKASLAYLCRVAAVPKGAASLGRRPGTWASFLHFRAFALSIFDRITLWFGREKMDRFHVSGREHYERLLTQERGCIVVGAHLGSFDALRALADQDGRVINVLMYTENAPRINSFLQQLSPQARIRVIEAGARSMDTVLRIRSCIERGELLAMLGDRLEPTHGGRSCQVTLLGETVAIPEAPYLLAALLGCPIFFMVALREKGGSYRVIAEVLSEHVELRRGEREKTTHELAANYAARLEHYCLSAPTQWFNFYDYWGDAES